MKFLVITDLHENASAVDWINDLADKNDVECILFLGDVTDMGTSEDGRKILECLKKEVYLIPGNCDPESISKDNADIIHDVHGKAFEIGGIRFAALGGSNPTIFDTPCELQEDEITKRLEAISSDGSPRPSRPSMRERRSTSSSTPACTRECPSPGSTASPA